MLPHRASRGAEMAVSVFTVDGEAPARRLDAWRARISETFVGLDCEAERGGLASGSVASSTAGPLHVSHVRTVAQRVRRTPKLIRRDGAETILVSLQLSGEGVVAQDGRAARLRPGAFALYDSTRPYDLVFDGPFEQVVLHMPRRVMAARIARLDALTALSLSGGGAAATAGFLGALGPALREASAEEAEGLGRVALDLLALGLARLSGSAPLGGPAAEGLRRRAKAAMEARLAEPGLASADVAAEIGVSLRRLQEAFAEAGETPSGWLRARRLDQAATRLRDPALAGATITEIALDAGFADAAHFSRRFRARFGAPPRRARSRA